MRERVGKVDGGTFDARFEQSLQSVVVRVTQMPPPGQKAVVRVGTQRVAVAQERAGCPVALRNSVDVRRGELVDRPVPYVRELQGSFFREAALHREIPLQGIRSCVGRIKSATRRHGSRRELAGRERGSAQGAGITARI